MKFLFIFHNQRNKYHKLLFPHILIVLHFCYQLSYLSDIFISDIQQRIGKLNNISYCITSFHFIHNDDVMGKKTRKEKGTYGTTSAVSL